MQENIIIHDYDHSDFSLWERHRDGTLGECDLCGTEVLPSEWDRNTGRSRSGTFCSTIRESGKGNLPQYKRSGRTAP